MRGARLLPDWLKQFTGLQSGSVDFDGLCQVAQRLGVLEPAPISFIVAGTNGKGSTCEFIEGLCRAAGMRVGKATSPHVLAFNERIQIDGEPVSDDVICRAFEVIDAACRGILLNYFQASALASLLIFRQQCVDVAVLEVGLGGRLDPMNVVDATVSVITRIDLDHQATLGDTREAIAAEKAGIMRRGRVCIVADPDPPASLLRCGRQVGSRVQWLGRDFDLDGRSLKLGERVIECPDVPQLPPASAAAAAAAVAAAGIRLSDDDLGNVIVRTRLVGRRQYLQRTPDVLLDVAHNAGAISSLAEVLRARPEGTRTRAVVGMYRDKLGPDIFDGLPDLIDQWYVTDMPEQRAAGASEIAAILHEHGCSVRPYAKISDAYSSALANSASDDMIVAFGSFLLVAGVLRATVRQQP